jgi:hypothetical protein
MADKLEVKRGTKVEDDIALVPGKFAIMQATAPDQQVEGQYYYGAMTQCPWCGHVGWTRGLSSEIYEVVICGYCGHRFRA